MGRQEHPAALLGFQLHLVGLADRPQTIYAQAEIYAARQQLDMPEVAATVSVAVAVAAL
jgi:hypothetical protein